MALSTLATPGVYIQEISTLPPSIAALSTAVPAFIGYTETGPKNSPVRITSLLDFEATFGRAYSEIYTVKINADGTVAIDTTATSISPYILYYHLQMYFGNGGGPCHIISVGHYDHTPLPSITVGDFYTAGDSTKGVPVAEEVDEVTLLVAPEVAELSNSADIRSVYDGMLAQCDKLKDRFAIFDVQDTNNPSADAALFRNSQISANFLKYGAAYYPSINTILKRRYFGDDVIIDDLRTPAVYGSEPNDRLSTILGGLGVHTTFAVTNPPAASDTIAITAFSTSATLNAGDDFLDAGTDAEIAASIVSAINNHPTLSLVVRAQLDSASPDKLFIVTRIGSGTAGDLTVTVSNAATWTTPTVLVYTAGSANSQDTLMYTSIINLIGREVLNLNSSATMAGIYASVDSSRGVWKAPANVSIANIIGPDFQITEAQQGGLNIDATSGKSINAIRSFVGRGTLVWGSRTLDGNSNEWRYVPVRRLFTFVEESCKKATEFVVFEPNDKSTWLRVQGTISNFLTDLWKQGALAGSKPDQAFFVRVGLGETMTAQDILEGKMIVSIGMAAVRPAEFIVLQFMHKLQEA